MTGCPSPFTLMIVASHRQEALHAEADRHRLSQLARPNAQHRSRWPDITARAGVMLVLTLPFLAALRN
jgi:hypothetical protein